MGAKRDQSVNAHKNERIGANQSSFVLLNILSIVTRVITNTMITFIISLIALVLGFILYGTLVERVFGIDPKAQTPALTKTDGVDFVPMKPWRIFLVQFLNIAGLGPIFGAIMGIFYGPAAFLWIVLGTIFAGGVHDYLSGMISLRKGGASLPEVVGTELGKGVQIFMRLLSIVLLVLLTTTFLSGPATLLQGLAGLGTMTFQGHLIPIVWVLIIFGYYTLATEWCLTGASAQLSPSLRT